MSLSQRVYYRGKALLLFLTLLFFACSPLVSRPSSITELKPAVYDTMAEDYRIGAGDRLEIRFFFLPELNDILQVQPDGKISLMFAHDIKVAGKTTQEVEEILHRKLARHLKQSDLSVSVNSFGSQRVYVGGEVSKPGAIQLSSRPSLLQVLGEAGWVTPAARHDEIVIVRRTQDREAVYHVNMAQIISGEDVGQDITLMAGDVVLVPPSRPVVMDRWVDQNIKSALPFGLGASYIYTNNQGSGIFK